MTIEEGLVAYLKTAAPTLKIFPQIAPESQAAPYAVYYRSGTDRWRTFSSEGEFVSSFSISIYAAGYGAMVALRNTIRGLLEIKTGVFGTGSPAVQAIEINNEMDLYEQDTKLHHGSMEFTIYHN